MGKNISNFILIFLVFIVVVPACNRPVIPLDSTAKVESLLISCDSSQMPQDVYFSCEATGIYSDGSSRNVTYQVQWEVIDPSLAQFMQTQSPRLRGMSVGATMIRASLDGVSASFPITITGATPVSLVVAPPEKIFEVGNDQTMTAICIFSDNTYVDVTQTASWTSQDISVVEVQADIINGATAVAVGPGATTVTASFGGIQASSEVVVHGQALLAIQISPQSTTVIEGLSVNYTATGIYADFTTVDLTDDVTWSIHDGSIASVSNMNGNEGVLLGLQAGATAVEANYGEFSDSTDVTVTNPVLTSLTISPINPAIAKGLTQQLTAMGSYSDGSTVDITEFVTWSSLAAGTATVDDTSGTKGLVTALAVGSTTISATLGAISDSTTVTVDPALLISVVISPASPILSMGQNQALTATGLYTDGTMVDETASATWSSSQPGYATVSDAPGTKGLVNTVATGSTIVSATVGSTTGQTTVMVVGASLTSISVTPASPSIAKGLTTQFMATGTYSDGSTADITSLVTWASNAPATATVSNVGGTKGLAVGAGMGSTTITATLGVVGQASITVTAPQLISIAVTPANSTINLLSSVQMTATGTYTDGSTANITSSVTWSSSNVLTATVSNSASTKGRASGVGLGTTTISATASGGIVGSTQLNGIL